MQQWIFFLIISFLLFFETGYTQDCDKYHELYCTSYEFQGYKSTLDSRSFTLKKGAVASSNAQFVEGMDYHISFAVGDLFGSQLFFQILDKQTQDIIYDNTEDNFNLNMEFSAIKTIDVNIIIETPISVSENERNDLEGCVGMLIETRITPPLGFTK